MFSEIVENYEILITEFFVDIFDEKYPKSICRDLIDKFFEYSRNYNITPSIIQYCQMNMSYNLIDDYSVKKKLKVIDKMLETYKMLKMF